MSGSASREYCRLTTGAVARGRARPLVCSRWNGTRALVRGRQTCGHRNGQARASPPAAGRSRARCRGEPATMRRAVMHQARATTRRRPLPSSTSSGHGDTARHDPQVQRLRARPSPAQRSACRCRGGAGRWAIRWVAPCRIGPYQAQRRALTGATVWSALQVFRRLGALRTPCFTRERSQVRNPPRPSKR